MAVGCTWRAVAAGCSAVAAALVGVRAIREELTALLAAANVTLSLLLMILLLLLLLCVPPVGVGVTRFFGLLRTAASRGALPPPPPSGGNDCVSTAPTAGLVCTGSLALLHMLAMLVEDAAVDGRGDGAELVLAAAATSNHMAS